MDLEFLVLNGYGQFVWPAFVFTFVCCFFLYLKTKKELLRSEKIFAKQFNKLYTEKIETSPRREKAREALSISSI